MWRKSFMFKMKTLLGVLLISLVSVGGVQAAATAENAKPARLVVTYNKGALSLMPTKSGISSRQAKDSFASSREAQRALRMLFRNYRSGLVECNLPGKEEKFVVVLTFPVRQQNLTRSANHPVLPQVVIKGPWDEMPQDVLSFVESIAFAQPSSAAGLWLKGGAAAAVVAGCVVFRNEIAQTTSGLFGEKPSDGSGSDCGGHCHGHGHGHDDGSRSRSGSDSDSDGSRSGSGGDTGAGVWPSTPGRRDAGGPAEHLKSPFKSIVGAAPDEQDVLTVFCRAFSDDGSGVERFQVFDAEKLSGAAVDAALLKRIDSNKVLVFSGEHYAIARRFAALEANLRAKNIKLVVVNCGADTSCYASVDGILWCKNEPAAQTLGDVQGKKAGFMSYWKRELGLSEAAAD
jgi:hypothetical protein